MKNHELAIALFPSCPLCLGVSVAKLLCQSRMVRFSSCEVHSKIITAHYSL